MRHRSLALATAAVLTSACSQTLKPEVERPSTPVKASAGRTWDTVVEMFAERNLPIRMMERSSGYIVTDVLSYRALGGNPFFYDCGGAKETPAPATHAIYNVVVRGDSATSSVRMNVRWVRNGQPCTSQGGWEYDFEALVKTRAEATR